MTTAPEWTYRHATELRNHWWWRPGWHVGTRFYAWHITFDQADDLHRVVDYWQGKLRSFEFLDLIPREWLHLTMQGVGGVEDVSDVTRARIIAAVGKRLGGLPPIQVQFQRPVVRREAIVLPAIPPDAVIYLRRALRAGMADVLGAEAVPEDTEGFQPHVSAAYVNRDQPASAIVDLINSAETPEAAQVDIAHTDLIVMHRDNRMYEWRTIEMVAVGRPRT